jgi:hypothetical protein
MFGKQTYSKALIDTAGTPDCLDTTEHNFVLRLLARFYLGFQFVCAITKQHDDISESKQLKVWSLSTV